MINHRFNIGHNSHFSYNLSLTLENPALTPIPYRMHRRIVHPPAWKYRIFPRHFVAIPFTEIALLPKDRSKNRTTKPFAIFDQYFASKCIHSRPRLCVKPKRHESVGNRGTNNWSAIPLRYYPVIRILKRIIILSAISTMIPLSLTRSIRWILFAITNSFLRFPTFLNTCFPWLMHPTRVNIFQHNERERGLFPSGFLAVVETRNYGPLAN